MFTATLLALFAAALPGSEALALTADTPELAVRAAVQELARQGELRLPSRPFEGMLPPGPGVSFAARALPEQSDGDRLFFEVVAYRGGQAVERRAYAFPLVSVRAVVVPRRGLRSGEVLAPEDLQVVEVEVPFTREPLAVAMEEVVGKRARTTLPADRPIQLRQLRAVEVVKRGHALAVRVARGSLVVTMTGEALESGGEGEVIQVANSNSRRPVRARVLGPNLAEVIAE
jgi:flagella basal body P-ring formation protein FlgA